MALGHLGGCFLAWRAGPDGQATKPETGQTCEAWAQDDIESSSGEKQEAEGVPALHEPPPFQPPPHPFTFTPPSGLGNGTVMEAVASSAAGDQDRGPYGTQEWKLEQPQKSDTAKRQLPGRPGRQAWLAGGPGHPPPSLFPLCPRWWPSTVARDEIARWEGDLDQGDPLHACHCICSSPPLPPSMHRVQGTRRRVLGQAVSTTSHARAGGALQALGRPGWRRMTTAAGRRRRMWNLLRQRQHMSGGEGGGGAG